MGEEVARLLFFIYLLFINFLYGKSIINIMF